MYAYIYICMRVLWYAHAYEIIQIFMLTSPTTLGKTGYGLRVGWESVSARVKSLKGRALANWVCAICVFACPKKRADMFAKHVFM